MESALLSLFNWKRMRPALGLMLLNSVWAESQKENTFQEEKAGLVVGRIGNHIKSP